MAMNKAEAAALELALTRAALGWPSVPKPAPYTREEVAAKIAYPLLVAGTTWTRHVVKAWFYNVYSSAITEGWIDIGGNYHAPNDPELLAKSVTRDFGRGFKSYDDAKAAMWWDKAMQCAKSLRAIELLQPPTEG